MKKYILILILVILIFNVDFKNDRRIGRDTMLYICDGKFQLLHSINDNLVIMPDDESIVMVVLPEVYDYYDDFLSGKLYFYSSIGYAVVDRNKKLCKVWYNITEDEKKEGTIRLSDNTEWDYFHEISYINKHDNDILLVIDLFEDFDSSEQKIFLRK